MKILEKAKKKSKSQNKTLQSKKKRIADVERIIFFHSQDCFLPHPITVHCIFSSNSFIPCGGKQTGSK